MSTITVVKKNGQAAIAADTLTKWGYIKESSKYITNHQKIFRLGNNLIGIVGSMSVAQAIEDCLTNVKRRPVLNSTANIFKSWITIHERLKAAYLLNPQEDDDDPVESTQSDVLIANPYGIFGVSAHRSIFEYAKFYAYGSGHGYAMGAMYAAYEDGRFSAEEIARLGVMAAAEFDDGTDTPVLSHTLRLRMKRQ
jgi:ATP-dependent protease HslVU (ClpYQ) peptidase subunit